MHSDRTRDGTGQISVSGSDPAVIQSPDIGPMSLIHLPIQIPQCDAFLAPWR